MKKRLLITLLLVVPLWLRAQTVSGTVTDAATGETLMGATILDEITGKGTITNAYGRYTLTLHADTAYLRVSYIGYRQQHFPVSLRSNLELGVGLVPSVELDEVTVTAERVNSPRTSQMSAVELPIEHLKMVPVMFGESDVLKTLQLLPGVQSGTEGTSGIYVRGGGPDENLFLLDGIPLYNVNHLGGFFSAFNSDAVKNVTLYKGSFPARFTGRISSVLDITTNNGNDREWHGGASIGLLAGKLSVEGPIIKEKTTVSLSFRRTYADLLLKSPLSMAVSLFSKNGVNAGYYFYDLNGKVTHKFSERSRLYATFYSGDDGVYLGAKIAETNYGAIGFKTNLNLNYTWGNLAAALRWNYVLNPKLFMNITGSYTQYRNRLEFGLDMETHSGDDFAAAAMTSTYNSGIRDISLNADFDYSPAPEHSIKFGTHFTHHIFTPEVTGGKNSFSSNDTAYNHDTIIGQSVVHAEEMSLFVEDDWSLTDALKLNAGLAATGFLVEGRFYPSLQPRLSARFLITEDLSVKAGYSYMTQYMHLLSSSNISLPTDLWVPVTARIAPMSSHQVAAGVFYNWFGIADFSIEGYYKWMHNLMEYLPGSSFFGSSTGWEDKVCLGDGKAYGIEFLAQRTVGKFTGWVGYTWSRTWRMFDMLNNGEPFPAKYDRIHDISVSLQYKHNKRFDCGLTWVYSTGNTATLAMQEFETDSQIEDSFSGYVSNAAGFVDSRNNYRLPPYHRLDLSVNFHRFFKRGYRTISISIYNVYNQQNPFIIYKSNLHRYTAADGTVYGSALVQRSLFPIIPSIAYIRKF